MKTKKLSLQELNAVVAAYVDATKIGTSFTATFANSAGLLDKIAKNFTIDGNFADKLAFMDGEELPLGKTLEEWYADLILPQDYEDGTTGTDYTKTLAPYDQNYRPNAYSYSLGRKFIPITQRNNDLQRACDSQGEYVTLSNYNTKRMYDSEAMFKFGVKKEIIAKAVDRIADRRTNAGTFSASAAYDKNNVTCLQSTASSGIYGVVVKDIPASSSKTWDERVADGSIIVLEDYKQLDVPTDTASGEAFIEAIKSDVESLSFATEGYSWHGNTVGACETGLVLIIKKGVMPKLSVQTLAGAFQKEELAIPCEVVVVDNIPSTKGWAVLTDERAMRLHPDYKAVRIQENAKCDFSTYFLHEENTAFISNNCAIIAYHA